MSHNPGTHESAVSRLYIKVISAIGLCLLAYALGCVLFGQFSLEWLLLSLVTVLIVARTDIQIPKIANTVTLDDTFIYISVLLYGVAPSVALAGINAAVCSLHYANKRRVLPFNAAVMSLSVFASATVTTRLFAQSPTVGASLGRLLLMAQTMALIHYVLNSGLVSIVSALRSQQNLLKSWRETFLWTSVSYFAGAIAACLVVKLISVISFYAFIIIVPMLGITFLTYKNYLDKMRVSFNHAQEMADLHLRTIEALAIAIDAKDEVTHDHVHRVQTYATGVGRLFGLSESEIEALKAGALLHDIGKLAVPDYILNKPSPLTAAEFDKMKVHTIVGAEILERVGFPYPVVPVVRHHHERWDGRGYPDGLKGDEIPITARILMVVDCFDAVREDRQYRKAMTREQAIQLLKDSSGTTYDPEVVRVFINHLPEFEEEIRRRHHERQETQPTALNSITPKTRKTDTRPVAFEQIRNAHREVITLYDIAQTIGTSLDLRDMFAVFSSRLEDIVSYTTCVLYLQKPDSIELEAAHVVGRHAAAFKGKSIVLGSGVTGWVVSQRQPMYNTDPRSDIEAAKIELSEPYRTVMCVPLLKDDEALGALTLYSTELSAYEPDHLRLLEAVAKLAADAIANALHHQRTEVKALTDLLTGLPNARSLRLQFEKTASQAHHYGVEFAILMMDLDGFKAVNDTLGHKVGDQALREVAHLLLSHIRSTDFLSRYAGDEFVAILQVNATEVADLVKRLQETIDKHQYSFQQIGMGFGVSIGWACHGVDGNTLDELLLAADRSMYTNKFKRKAAFAEGNYAAASGASAYPIM